MKAFRDIRILPVALIAILGLAILKIAGLVIDGGYVFEYQAQQPVKSDHGRRRFSISPPARRQGRSRRYHRFGHGAQEEKKAEGGRADRGAPEGVVVFPEQNAPPVSASERAILERLQARRQELEQRAREIEIRESLLKAAEKRIEDGSRK